MLALSECLMGSDLTHRARALVRQGSSLERPIQASLSRGRAQWAVGALRERWNQNATAWLIEVPQEKNAEKQVGFGVNGPC